jgi:DNA-binding MarR family transcriptional regulator
MVSRLSSEVAPVDVRLGEAVQRYQASVTDFDREVARLMGVNETDLRCLEVLLEAPATPSHLSVRLGLTTGSVTAMLDRLEKLDYLARSPHPTDRRKTVVSITPKATERAFELITPLIDDGRRRVRGRYTAEQLELVIDFLTFVREVEERHLARLRDISTPHRTKRSERATTG